MKSIICANLERNNEIETGNRYWERVGKDICRQIFEKHGYCIHDFDPDVFKRSRSFDNGPEYGIDKVILNKEIPVDDTLRIKELETLNPYHDYYAIDCKCVNNWYRNSIYVKLMPDQPFRYYTEGKVENRVDQYRDKVKININKSKKKEVRISLFDLPYGNRQILGYKNSTDIFFFAHFDKSMQSNHALINSYLVPAEQLRHQVVDILNKILESEGKKLIELKKDVLYLNHGIKEAYSIFKDNCPLPENQIELFKFSGGDITLRIPEEQIINYTKFNQFGEIIH